MWHFYPTRAKTSVWDLFGLASGAKASKAFSYVAVRAPHGKPMHMYPRYGAEQSVWRPDVHVAATHIGRAAPAVQRETAAAVQRDGARAAGLRGIEMS
jgi:hypothetical protein